MQFSHHVIKNVGLHATAWKTVKATILFNVGAVTFWHRKQFLTAQDYEKSIGMLEVGDIVLVGNHRRLIALLLRGLVTHSLLYVGNGMCIHADADGVETITYKDIFDFYDTLIIVRTRATVEQKKHAVERARKNISLPYDFNFNPASPDEFFCTELVCDAFHDADVDLKPCIRHFRAFPRDLDSETTTHVFHSVSLVEEKNHLALNPKFYSSAFLRRLLV